MMRSWPTEVKRGAPAFRASFAHESMKTLRERPEWDEIEKAFEKEALVGLRGAPTSGWLPLSFDIEMCRAAADVLTPAALRSMGLRNVQRTSQKPLLAPFEKASRTLIHHNPAAGIRFMARGVAALYRDCGTFEVRNSPAPFPELVWCQPPPEAFSSSFVEPFAGGFEYFFEVLRTSGRVDASVDEKIGEIRFRFRPLGRL